MLIQFDLAAVEVVRCPMRALLPPGVAPVPVWMVLSYWRYPLSNIEPEIGLSWKVLCVCFLRTNGGVPASGSQLPM